MSQQQAGLATPHRTLGVGGVSYFCPLLKSRALGNIFFVLWLYLSRSLMILQLTSWTVSWMVRDLELHWSSTSVSHASLPLSSVPVDEDSMEPFLLMAKQALLAATFTMLVGFWGRRVNIFGSRWDCAGAGKSHTMTGPTDGPVELQGTVLRWGYDFWKRLRKCKAFDGMAWMLTPNIQNPQTQIHASQNPGQNFKIPIPNFWLGFVFLILGHLPCSNSFCSVKGLNFWMLDADLGGFGWITSLQTRGKVSWSPGYSKVAPTSNSWGLLPRSFNHIFNVIVGALSWGYPSH